MQAIDLRSDTFTKPSPEMREAMYRAEVGDDVYGEDPTVNRLQEMAAERTGKEAALFVASGTMGNLVSILTHCNRGSEMILGDQSHIILHEQGGCASLASVFPRTVRNEKDGTLCPEQLESLINKGDDDHIARTDLICLENSWNGRILRPAYLERMSAIAKKHSIPMHLDGARVFNAAVALGVEIRELTKAFDSIQFCLSKGLAAPVGSLICGSAGFIARARRSRKLVGGGMRQSGILAAAGAVALDRMVERLADDHDNAKILANGLAEISAIEIDLRGVETNIVMFKLKDGGLSAAQAVERLASAGLLVLPMEGNYIRAVTHYGIESAHIKQAIDIAKSILGAKVAV